MGYKTRIQQVIRQKSRSYYVNFPSAIAQAMEINKGEEFEWVIKDKSEIILRRAKGVAVKKRTKKHFHKS